jgi:dUTP pyrophosphatase
MSNQLKFARVNPNAVIPTKGTPHASGWDLTAISVHKRFFIPISGEDEKSERAEIIMYDTGIKVRPPDGKYTVITPRSSIIKTGYLLANNIGIIDEDYRGHLYIAVVKLDPRTPDFKLPFKKFQLLLLNKENAEAVEVDESELDETERGSGGFGSTDLRLPSERIVNGSLGC